MDAPKDNAPDLTIHSQPNGRLLVLALASLGIVYGDIGTSPLYTLRECFYGSHAVAPTQPNLLGVISLILWSLFLIISVKYLVLILPADNRGEGGILALATLLRDEIGRERILSTNKPDLSRLRGALFVWMSQNTGDPLPISAFLQIMSLNLAPASRCDLGRLRPQRISS